MSIRRLFHRLELISRLSGLNLRLTAITLVGLTIGLSMLGATFIQLDSTRVNYYVSTLEETSNHDIRITASGTFRDDLWDIQLGFRNIVREKINEHSLIKEDTNYFPYFGIHALHLIGIYGLNDSILAECVTGSRLPQNQSEVLLFANITTDDPISLNDQVNISYESDQPDEYRTPLTVVGLLIPSSLANQSILLDLMKPYTNKSIATYFPELIYNAYCFINSMNYSLDLVQTIKTEIDNRHSQRRFDIHFHFKYVLDPTIVTKENAIELVAHIYDFKLALPYRYEGYSIYWGAWFSYLEQELMKFDVLYPSFLLVSTPVFLIVALLVSFSLGLINEKRQKALVLLKNRGIANQFIFLTLLIETIILAFCSAVFALIIGIPLTLFLGSSTGLLAFNRPIDLSRLVLSFRTIQNIFLIAFFFTFLFHLPSLVRLSRLELFKLAEDAERKSKRKIRVLIGKLDVLFLTLGLVGILALFILMNLLKAEPAGQAAFITLSPFIVPFLAFSFGVFLIGFISTFNRLFSKIIHKLGRWFWRRDWRGLAIATRNLGVDIKVTSRITLLLAATLALVVVFSTLPLSLYQYQVDNAFYTVGSEVSYTVINRNELTGIVSALSHVEGFRFTTINELTIYNYTSSFAGTSSPISIRFMGITEDFTQVAHWRNHYDDESLEALVSALFSASEVNSVIVDSTTMNREELSIDSTYNITLGDISLPVSVQGVTNYWPRLINKWSGKDSFFVTRAAVLDGVLSFLSHFSYQISYSNIRYSNTVLGRILPGYNKDQVLAAVRLALIAQGSYNSANLVTVYDFDILQEDNITTTFFWFLVNINLLAALVIILSAIILFTITRTFRRMQEIAVSRSLGMKFRQIFMVMIAESLVVFLLSGIPGTIVGSVLFFIIFTSLGQSLITGPTLVIQFDLMIIFGYYLLILLVSVLTGFVASRMTTQANIAKILTME
ncbi:MAG: FtsX-like permease family protein, partial [Candidatus Hermodarchaeota archaeon]